MPNLCSYAMKVVGQKEKIEEFIKVMQCNYDYYKMEFDFDRHIGGRVFDADVYEFKEIRDGVHMALISGSCAWSVHSCMFGGAHTYYEDLKSQYFESCRSTTVRKESDTLGLDIEIFSEESGCEFMEHYLIRKGNIEIDDCVEYHEYWVEDYETKEEAEQKLGIEITDEEWSIGQDDGRFARGGMEWDFQI